MKQGKFRVTENVPLMENVMRMRMQGDTSAFTAPGQFMNIQIPGYYLRRPMSLCDLNGDIVTVVYRVKQEGTQTLAAVRPGDELDVLSGLGNGFDLELSGDSPILIGGGLGIPPLLLAARRLIEQGKRVGVVLGFKTRWDALFSNEFYRIGAKVIVEITESRGHVLSDFIPGGLNKLEYSYFYTCGPLPMLKAVHRETRTSGQFSLEERMGCGFGACLACTCETLVGNKRICKDGPVFKKEELPWNA